MVCSNRYQYHFIIVLTECVIILNNITSSIHLWRHRSRQIPGFRKAQNFGRRKKQWKTFLNDELNGQFNCLSVSESKYSNFHDALSFHCAVCILYLQFRWGFSIHELLKDPAGKDQLAKFLDKEFSQENLRCILIKRVLFCDQSFVSWLNVSSFVINLLLKTPPKRAWTRLCFLMKLQIFNISFFIFSQILARLRGVKNRIQ